MTLPRWVEQEVENIPGDYSGRVVVTINCWSGGVTDLEISYKQHAPKPEESRKHVMSA